VPTNAILIEGKWVQGSMTTLQDATHRSLPSASGKRKGNDWLTDLLVCSIYYQPTDLECGQKWAKVCSRMVCCSTEFRLFGTNDSIRWRITTVLAADGCSELQRADRTPPRLRAGSKSRLERALTFRGARGAFVVMRLCYSVPVASHSFEMARSLPGLSRPRAREFL
jgi:hypothetical protein